MQLQLVGRSARQVHGRPGSGRLRGSVKVRLAPAAAWFAVGCIAAARMPWRLLCDAASASAGTTTPKNTPACAAPGCGRWQRTVSRVERLLLRRRRAAPPWEPLLPSPSRTLRGSDALGSSLHRDQLLRARPCAAAACGREVLRASPDRAARCHSSRATTGSVSRATASCTRCTFTCTRTAHHARHEQRLRDSDRSAATVQLHCCQVSRLAGLPRAHPGTLPTPSIR